MTFISSSDPDLKTFAIKWKYLLNLGHFYGRKLPLITATRWRWRRKRRWQRLGQQQQKQHDDHGQLPWWQTDGRTDRWTTTTHNFKLQSMPQWAKSEIIYLSSFYRSCLLFLNIKKWWRYSDSHAPAHSLLTVLWNSWEIDALIHNNFSNDNNTMISASSSTSTTLQQQSPLRTITLASTVASQKWDLDAIPPYEKN